MKTKILSFSAAMIVSFALQGQNDAKDTIEIDFGKTKVLIFNVASGIDSNGAIITFGNDTTSRNTTKKKKFKVYWDGIEFGVNGLMSAAKSFNLSDDASYLNINYGRSLFFNFNFMQMKLPVYKNKAGFITGLGLNTNNYKFIKKNLLLGNSDSITYSYDTINEYYKNKLTTVSLTVPLLFQLNFPEHNNFHIIAGVYGTLLLSSYLKTVYSNPNDRSKNKTHGLPYLNPLGYGVTARIGIGNFSFIVNYNLTTLIKKDNGPELYPINMGVAFDL